MTLTRALPAISWFLLSILLSNISDLAAKYLGDGLHHSQITCARFAISLLLLLPFLDRRRDLTLSGTHTFIHLLRGSLLCLGTSIWFYGLTQVPIANATAVGFSIPFFTILLAAPLLGERISFARFAAVACGFLGVSIILGPACLALRWGSLTLLLATSIYALLDVINKRMVTELSTVNLLFFSSLVGTAFSFGPALSHWSTPTLFQFALLIFLGSTANLILYCMLRAFRLEEASFLSPFRYVELVFSATFGFLIFGEVPTLATLLGAFVIILSMLALSYFESRIEEPVEAFT